MCVKINLETILEIETEYIENDIRYAFNFLSKKLDAAVRHHTKKLSSSYEYDQTKVMYPGVGSLKYYNKSVYIKELHNEKSGIPIISLYTDDSLGYQFFMYRLITSAKEYEIIDANGILQSREYKIGPTYVITFDENSNESYDNIDVMTLFKYVNSQGVKIPTYADNVINNEVSEILKADIEGLKNIIKDVFTRHGTFCNTLKNIDPKYYKEATVKSICHSAYDIEDQDYFVQCITCQEVFTLASIDEFCPDMIREYEFLDDL